MKDIDNNDENGRPHGYQEWYDRWPKTIQLQLAMRLTYFHGRETGYEECHMGELCYYYII